MFEMDDDEEDNEHTDLPYKKYQRDVDVGKLQVPSR